MAAIQFPANPNAGDLFTAGNGIRYTYDGEKWKTLGTSTVGTEGQFLETPTVLTIDKLIPANTNTGAVGPMAINTGVTLTIPATSTFRTLSGRSGTGSGGITDTGPKMPISGGTFTGPVSFANNTIIKGNAIDGSGKLTLNCENNSHGINIKGPPHSAGANYTLTLPNDTGTNGQALITNGSGVSSWSTIDLSSKLSLTGGTLTGDLGIGNYPNDGGTKIFADEGQYTARKDDGSGGLLLYRNGTNNSDKTVQILSDGSITAVGNLTIGDKIIHNGDTNTAVRFPASDTVSVETAGSERLRIDSSGNILVGKTASTGVTAGCELRPAGMGVFTRASANPLQVRRLTDDGDLVEFYQDSGLIGSIGVQGSSLTVGMAGPERLRIDSSGNVIVGGTSTSSTNAAYISQNGTYVSNRTAGTNDLFNGKLNGTVTSTINADGSASFAGGNTTISVNGWIQTNDTFTANRTAGSAGVFSGKLNGTTTSSIKADGSATYAGTVTANAFSGDGSALTNLPAIENSFASSAPSSPGTGDFWVDTTNTPPELKSYNGSAWVAVGSSAPTTSAPVINGVTLSEASTAGARFTSKAFNIAVTMLDNGTPISQKGVKGKVTATFAQFPVSNAITAGTVSTSQTSEGNTTKDSSTNLTHNESTGAICFNVVDTSTNSVRCFMWYPEGSGSSYDDMLENSGKDLLAYTSVDNDFYGSGEYKQGLAGVQNRLGTWVNIMGRHNNIQAAFEISGLLSGNPSRQNKNEVSTDAYKYISTGRNLTRYDLNGQNGISLFLGGVPYSGGGGPYFMETLSDRIFIVSQSSTSGSLWTKELTDAASANLSNGNTIYQDNNQSGFNRYDITGCIFHKGKVLISKGVNGGGIYAFTPGTSSPTLSSIPAAPSGYQNTYGAIWEDPLGNLILRTTHFSTDWSTQAAFYYSSNNSGATWVANHYAYDSNFNYEYWTPDLYLYGRRQKSKRIKGSGSAATVTKQVYTIRSQTLTVTNGADLSSLNVGDIVRPPGETDPLKYSKIDSISSNGNGTTNVVVNGFNDFAVGNVIEATASTGTATSTRFLVINAQGAITTHQVSDPGFVTQGPGTSQTITFPATFPTGNAPDVELPSGTTIQVDVQAVNSAASDTYASNTVTPS